MRYFFAFLFFSAEAMAGVQLPLHSLRDQATTRHCWSYAMANFLESRSLTSHATEATIDIEQDVKYWVDYERMMYIFNSKHEFYLGEDEGGWQIEFFEAFVKHGRSIYQAKETTPEILYPLFKPYTKHMKHMPVDRPPPDPTLMPYFQVPDHLMKNIKSEAEAKAFAIDYLNRYYGKSLETTKWLKDEVQLSEIPKLLMGPDHKVNGNRDALILIKPTEDKVYGWAKYIDDRYWGYRYDASQILTLIESSLNNGWPVTFDNTYHAMTIIGYETNTNGDTYYAVADSVPGKITWYASANLKAELNLVSVAAESVKGLLPPRARENLLNLALLQSRHHGTKDMSLDEIDHTDKPLP
jgi:hypothetical protein